MKYIIFTDEEVLTDGIRENGDLGDYFWDDRRIHGYKPTEDEVEDLIKDLYNNILIDLESALMGVKFRFEDKEEELNLFDYIEKLIDNGVGFSFEYNDEKDEFYFYIWDNFLEYQKFLVVEDTKKLFDKVKDVIDLVTDYLG